MDTEDISSDEKVVDGTHLPGDEAVTLALKGFCKPFAAERTVVPDGSHVVLGQLKGSKTKYHIVNQLTGEAVAMEVSSSDALELVIDEAGFSYVVNYELGTADYVLDTFRYHAKTDGNLFYIQDTIMAEKESVEYWK